MLDYAATAFVSFFVIIDPVGVLPIFMLLTHGQTGRLRRETAIKSILVAAATLVAFALAGEFLLHLLGITLPAFRIAGGILLLLLSIDMVFARQSGIRTTTDVETQEAEDRTDVAVFPLAVPLIAGPGAITSVILLMGRAEGNIILQSLTIVLLLLVLGLCLIAFLFASRLMDVLGVTGVNVIGRVFGIILAGLAIQYVLDGAAGVFPKLAGG
jgi:multiple antibiotic resistance protein